MRSFKAEILDSNFQIQCPFSLLLNGSSGWGKTTFCHDLIESNIPSRPITKVYLHYPEALGDPPVSWDEEWDHIDIQYEQGLPLNDDAWMEYEEGSLIILDDLWGEIIYDKNCANAIKVWRRKRNLNIIFTSQLKVQINLIFNYFISNLELT